MLQDGFNLRALHTGKPCEKLRDRGPIAEIFKQRRQRYACASKHPRATALPRVALYVLASVTLLAAQEVSGVEHWVEHAGLKLYVWEKYFGSPAGKPVVVLAHGSATAGRESFDLQVPGKPSYSLMDVLAREGFDVFALDTRGFGRSTRPEGHISGMNE